MIATNRAGLIALDTRPDLGLQVFVPDRSSSMSGNAFGSDQTLAIKEKCCGKQVADDWNDGGVFGRR